MCDIVGTNDDESVFSVDDGASDECSVTSDDSTPNGVDLVVADSVADNGLQMDRSGDAPDSAEVVVPLQSGVSGDPPSDHSVHQESLEMTNVCNSDLLLMVLWMVLSCRPQIEVWQIVETSQSSYFFYESADFASHKESKLLVNGPFQFSV